MHPILFKKAFESKQQTRAFRWVLTAILLVHLQNELSHPVS